MQERNSENPFARSEAEKAARLQRVRVRLRAASLQLARRSGPRGWSGLRAWQWIVMG